MNILVTALSLVALVGCFLAYTRCEAQATDAHTYLMTVEKLLLGIRAERDRITTLEREIAALRRELRKLAGKFYADEREKGERDAEDQIADAHVQTISAPYCPNYELAQREGPFSDAAKCKCNYCGGRRAAKDAYRRGQARAGHLDPEWVKAHAGGQVDVEEN